MPTEIVGREAALAEIDRFLDRAATEPAGLLLRGEPGIGKSTLWEAACDTARSRGSLVLTCRAAEAEVRFAFVGLRDALAPVTDRIAELPRPMAHALRVALLLEEADATVAGGSVEAATLALLRILAEDRAVVLAIDDVQWLDEPTRTAFAYVARRVRDAPIAFIAAERVEEPADRSRWLAESFGGAAVSELTVPPLSVGALHHLLRSRLDLALSRPRLVRLHELSGGNPFYGLEIGAAWRDEQPGAGSTSLPASLRELVARRLRALPARTRSLLLAAALASGEEVGSARLAMVLDAEPDAVRRRLGPALTAGVLEQPGEPVRFRHPLLAAAAVDEASPSEVRWAHERLADTTPSVEARGRHLAAARDAPDGLVAAALDAAAVVASGRGAAVDAAELRSLAVRFSPPDDARLQERLLAEAEACFIAGDLAAARERLEAAVPRVSRADLHVQALLLLATILWYDASSEAAIPIGTQALTEAGDDPKLLAQVHARMAWLCDNDLARAQGHAEAALRLLDPAADPALYAFALLNDAYLRLLLGVAADRDAVERGWQLQESARIWEFSTLAGNFPKLIDDFETARTRLSTYLGRVREQGDESSIGQIAGYLAELECWTGNLDVARALADEAVELGEETGQSGYLVAGLRHRALAEVIGGDIDTGRRDADRALEIAGESSDPMVVAGAQATRALVALTDGDAALVDRLCTAAIASLDAIGMLDHAPYRFQADHIEALVSLGELERAEALWERHAARAHLGPRPWIIATAARCDALIRAARGDLDAASASLAAARTAHARLDMPFELARTLLVEGQIARRANRRRDAVTAIEASIEVFDRLGSGPWSARARAELSRVGIRRGSGDALTPTELSVARLAARGFTNRQVASELYISPKTVEANLSRAYAKLGIRSRAELGAVMAERSEREAAKT